MSGDCLKIPYFCTVQFGVGVFVMPSLSVPKGRRTRQVSEPMTAA